MMISVNLIINPFNTYIYFTIGYNSNTINESYFVAGKVYVLMCKHNAHLIT